MSHKKKIMGTTWYFSPDEHYLFVVKLGSDYEVVVAKPTLVNDTEILFHFSIGWKSEGEFINKSDILGVGSEYGTTEIRGWSGKYRIINQPLFDQYVKEGKIELK